MMKLSFSNRSDDIPEESGKKGERTCVHVQEGRPFSGRLPIFFSHREKQTDFLTRRRKTKQTQTATRWWPVIVPLLFLVVLFPAMCVCVCAPIGNYHQREEPLMTRPPSCLCVPCAEHKKKQGERAHNGRWFSLCSKAQTIWFLAQRNGFIFFSSSSSFVFLVNFFSQMDKDRKELLAFLDTHLPITMRSTFLVIITNKNIDGHYLTVPEAKRKDMVHIGGEKKYSSGRIFNKRSSRRGQHEWIV